MNQLRRFLAVCNGERPDYVPTFGFLWASGVSGGVLRKTYDRLVETGMPDIGGAWESDGRPVNLKGWLDYWGVEVPDEADFVAGEWPAGIKSEKTVRDGFEYIEYETGALTRQFVDNDITYAMPEFIRHHVRDRESFERYKSFSSFGAPWGADKIDAACAPHKGRERPLCCFALGTWGYVRSCMMGPEAACTVFYDDPELSGLIYDWIGEQNRTYMLPVIERLKPEVVLINEDFCYNRGLFISPALFEEYCAPIYREIGETVKKAGVPVFALDTDGFAEPALPLVVPYGVNAVFPWEAKPGNDLSRVREAYPKLILFGGIEKECLNEGNEGAISRSIDEKRKLIQAGRYFPNADHGIQPPVTFENLCRFMTLLHEATGNPSGAFPRLYPK